MNRRRNQHGLTTKWVILASFLVVCTCLVGLGLLNFDHGSKQLGNDIAEMERRLAGLQRDIRIQENTRAHLVSRSNLRRQLAEMGSDLVEIEAMGDAYVVWVRPGSEATSEPEMIPVMNREGG
ncbi:MAG: hypothetical protein ACFCU3_02790 [Verrucomicrobiales bacterium]